MSWLDAAQLVLSLLSLLVMGFFLPLFKHIRALRENELKHIAEDVQRIEKKLDQHIAWHMEHGHGG